MIVLENNPKKILLVTLNGEAVKDIANLLAESRRDDAIMTALANGEIQGRISEDEMHSINADLLIRRGGSHWSRS